METFETKEAFLKAASKKVGQVDDLEIEGFGTVYLRVMTCDVRDSFEIACGRAQSGQFCPVRSLLVANVLCNKEGELLFTEMDVTLLGDRVPGYVSDAVFDKAIEVNRIGQKDIKDLEGNSSATPSSSSGTS